MRITTVTSRLVWAFAFVVGTCVAPTARAAVGVDDFMARTYDAGNGHTLPYRLFVPAGYDPAKKYPLVVFFHGAGGRGTDNRGQITDQGAPLVFVQPENQGRWPAFMMAPQCPPDQQWVDMPWDAASGKGMQPAQPTWPMAAAMAVVDKLQAEFSGIDGRRLYVTGMSMGGFGTWDAAIRNPTKWRAAVVICGGYDETKVAPILTLPLWAFHAADDPTVSVQRSRDMIAALRALGGAPRYTEYPASAGYGHFSWNPAYADPALLPWMFDGVSPGDGGVPVDAQAGGSDAPAGDTNRGGAGGDAPDAAGGAGGGGAGGQPAGGAGGGAGGQPMGGAGSGGAGGQPVGGTGGGGARGHQVPAPASPSGCSCASAGQTGSKGLALALGAAALALARRRRR